MSNNNNNTDFTSVADQSAFLSDSSRNLARSSEISDQALPNFVELPTDAPISSDEVDGRFKTLHPETGRDETTGHRYHVISEVHGLQRGARSEPVKLDMVAINVGKERKGKKQGAYLFTTREKMAGMDTVEQVYVDAHGGFNSLAHDVIILKSEMPSVVFLGPHKKILYTSPFVYNPYAEVSFEGITLTSKQAKADFDAFGYKTITGTSTMGAIRNYCLSKFVQKLRGEKKGMYYRDYTAFFMQDKRQLEESLRTVRDPNTRATILRLLGLEDKALPFFDTIAIRESGPELSARDTIEIAQEHRYKKIIFSFCRGSTNPFSLAKEVDYAAAETELLEQPLFYSWDDIKKLEMEKARVSESQEMPSCSTPRMSG